MTNNKNIRFEIVSVQLKKMFLNKCILYSLNILKPCANIKSGEAKKTVTCIS